MCGRGRAVDGPRYLNFVRAACEVGPTRYAGGVACRRVTDTVRGRSNSNSNSNSNRSAHMQSSIWDPIHTWPWGPLRRIEREWWTLAASTHAARPSWTVLVSDTRGRPHSRDSTQVSVRLSSRTASPSRRDAVSHSRTNELARQHSSASGPQTGHCSHTLSSSLSCLHQSQLSHVHSNVSVPL